MCVLTTYKTLSLRATCILRYFARWVQRRLIMKVGCAREFQYLARIEDNVPLRCMSENMDGQMLTLPLESEERYH